MNLFSVFRSSSVEILFSKRATLIVYGVLAALVFDQMFEAYEQFFRTYFELHQLDVSVEDFMYMTLVVLLPFWLTGALMLRACVQRLRLSWWIHQAAKVAVYETPLSPAEAGYLVDYDYTHREVAATLLGLQFRGILQITVSESSNVHLEVGNTSGELSPYERIFVETLVNSQENDFSGFSDPRLIEIASAAEEVLIEDLEQRNMVQRERLPNRYLRKLFRVIYTVAGIVGLLYAYAYLFERAQLEAIGYPRYPMNVTEIFILIAVGLVIVGVVVSGWWPRFTQEYKDPRYEAWIDAAGFLLYLRTVFSDRFSAEGIASQDKETLRTYTPYAVAYGIIPNQSERIAEIISLCK